MQEDNDTVWTPAQLLLGQRNAGTGRGVTLGSGYGIAQSNSRVSQVKHKLSRRIRLCLSRFVIIRPVLSFGLLSETRYPELI